VAIEGDVVKVRLGGACQDCHLSEQTLQGWVAGTIRQFFPEINLEAVH
jgi:Fe-S cluster biogenesis protein NfuA